MPSISLPVAILGAGALGVGASVFTGMNSANASKNAANAQVQAAQTAANTQLGIYNQTRSDLMPYNMTGQSALSQLAKMFGLSPGGNGTPNAGAATSALTQFPGYQFGLNQGQTALDRSAASRGMLLSGGQLKDSQQFGTNYAMQQAWNPYISQLTGMSSLGENAAAISGNQGVTTGQGVANSQLAAGQAQASGIVGSSNAINTGISSGFNAGLNSSLLAYQLGNNQYGGGLNGQINSGQALGISNGGYNYNDASTGYNSALLR